MEISEKTNLLGYRVNRGNLLLAWDQGYQKCAELRWVAS